MNTANFPRNKARKQAEAVARKAVTDALTLPQRLARLDTLFGPGLGAKRERARIQTKIEKAATKPVVETALIAAPAEPGTRPERPRRKERGQKRGA
jgi:hypothetical protein